MPQNIALKVIGYYDPEYGDCYCAKHARSNHLPIMNNDKNFLNERCSICGVYIDDLETISTDRSSWEED
jgi:hypothetical protein